MKKEIDNPEMIKIENLYKDYGNERGVFGVSLSVKKGEVYGFLGPNGAGKTTTIRHLLGFSKPDSGTASIFGLDCWNRQKDIQYRLGYVPGEISFPDHLTGEQFIKQIAALRKMKSLDKAKKLIELFEFSPKGELKRMSKGMKQKIALVIAFMHDPDLIILDEPTSGLDPLMQQKFVDLINEEKANGKTIFMSSHMYDEIEKTCDRVAIIKAGKIITEVSIKDIEHRKDKTFEIRFKNHRSYDEIASKSFNFIERNEEKTRVKILVNDDEINSLLKELSKVDVEYITEQKYKLEQFFMNYYRKEEKNV